MSFELALPQSTLILLAEGASLAIVFTALLETTLANASSTAAAIFCSVFAFSAIISSLTIAAAAASFASTRAKPSR